jgi:hypothetical protein
LLACLAFEPFAIACLPGGQLSAVGFFALAAATRWQRSGKPAAAGAALSLCLYKPTLLLLVLPMLAVGRRFRLLAGFAAGAAALGALSLAVAGRDGCGGYLRTLRLYGKFVSQYPTPLQLPKYVDIRTFLQLALNGHAAVSAIPALVLTGAALAYLAVHWARSRPGTQADGVLWAGTIAWSLVFNVYVPVYDVTLAVVCALVMAGVVYGARGEEAERDRAAFHGWMLLLYVTAVVAPAFAWFANLQLLTLVLVGTGYQALRLSRRREAAS